MPKYVPHTLPADFSRPNAANANTERKNIPNQQFNQQNRAQAQAADQEAAAPPAPKAHPAVLLGQHIRRERGMQGVRSYASQVREYLSPSEYQELCQNMGIKPEPEPTHEPQVLQGPMPASVPAQASTNNTGNQMQMLQLLTQILGMQGGAQAPNNATNALLPQLLGGQNNNANLLSQLLGGQASVPAVNAGGNNAGGINPMMLAQLLNGLK